jgi:hypothetical protein
VFFLLIRQTRGEPTHFPLGSANRAALPGAGTIIA